MLRVYVKGVLCCVLFTACQDPPLSATEQAKRITQPQAWLERQAELRQHELARNTITGETLQIPADLPAPELLPHTLQIHRLIDEVTGLAGAPPGNTFATYTEHIPAAGVSLRMLAVPGSTMMMGSPESEPHRKEHEGPRHQVNISPFWMSEIEIPWELYTAFMENGRPRAKDGQLLEPRPDDELWDAVTQPTAPYTAMNLGMGHGYEQGMPAIAMSHYAACKFCEWLSAQTGHYYRLPTEAEWEYACRAGSNTAYTYGNTEQGLDNYAWFWNNAQDRYQHVGGKLPNAFGLKDMHGNVAEWVLDSYSPHTYADRAGDTPVQNPVVIIPGAPHSVRGGSWDDDPDALRSAARRPSSPAWNQLDPQNPKSLWYLTNGGMVGFRVVRPVHVPDVLTMHKLWNFSKGES